MRTLLVATILVLFPISAFAAKAPDETYISGKPVKILIVPGHDELNPGAVFRGMREADMNLILGKKIEDSLSDDPLLEVVLARNENGYIAPLGEYFKNHKRDIERFIESHKEETEKSLKEDKIVAEGVPHNDARKDVAFRLYAINKWADESDFDFIINIHFNDDSSHWGNIVGKYGGYTVYAPGTDLPNARESRALAAAFGKSMRKTFSPTRLPLEKDLSDEWGVVPDSKLIALGANASLFTPSILVEYSYIYEPHVAKDLFSLSSDVFARATKNAVYTYLGSPEEKRNLAFEFSDMLGLSPKKNKENLALQYALAELGFYPPKNFDAEDCPFSGIFGPCTQRAAKEFLRANGLTADGIVGRQTNEILNLVF